MLTQSLDAMCDWQTYGQYWPEENEECECGPFVIEAVSVNRRTPDITVRELKMTFNQAVSSIYSPFHAIAVTTSSAVHYVLLLLLHVLFWVSRGHILETF